MSILNRNREADKKRINEWDKPVLFFVGGTLAGLAYYYFAGCSTGSCPISSNPIISMAYMGVVGWLLSGVFGKEGEGGCSM